MQQKWVKFYKKAFRLLTSNPSAFATRAKASLLTPILPSRQCEIKVNGVRFQIDPSVDPVMKQMCYGFYETEVTALIEKYVRKGDVCIDVGANIGYISAYMLGLVGTVGQVHSFEPVPQYFNRLKQVQTDNPNYGLNANACALGDKKSTAKICVTNLQNIGWNTMVPGLMNKDTIKEEIEVSVERLDDYLAAQKVGTVRLIKIDTEGYELPVLRGLDGFLRDTLLKPILIIEIAPAAYPRIGATLDELADYLHGLGYVARDIETQREVDVRALTSTTNILFLQPEYH